MRPSPRRSRLPARAGEGFLDPPRKTGWQVRASVAEAVKRAVKEGAAESQNAFVERALVRELRELRKLRIYDAYERAALDAGFRDEMREIAASFGSAPAGGLRGAEG